MVQLIKIIKNLSIIFLFFLLYSCVVKKQEEEHNILTTTGMIKDLTKSIVGEEFQVQSLMQSGSNPHSYKTTLKDIQKMQEADLIIYNGLNLEAGIIRVMDNLAVKNKKIFNLGEHLDSNLLIRVADKEYDPHIWFNVPLWEQAGEQLYSYLMHLYPEHNIEFTKNWNLAKEDLQSLHKELLALKEAVPKESRILITAHDAFSYFGKTYDFEVLGVQGISTEAEAGIRGIQQLSQKIVENKIKAIFVESSVSKKSIEALKANVQNQGWNVVIGGELYSDAMGLEDSYEGTYKGMILYNMKTIIGALQ